MKSGLISESSLRIKAIENLFYPEKESDCNKNIKNVCSEKIWQ